MHYLKEEVFSDPAIGEEDRWSFALAAYNAGPTRVRKWRKKAPARGLDPNRWFQNVEFIALEDIGEETVRYVSHVHKYYLAYRLSYERHQQKTGTHQAHGGGGLGQKSTSRGIGIIATHAGNLQK